MLQSELDGGFQKTQFAAAVVANTFISIGIHRFQFEQALDGVCELVLATCNGFELGDMLKNTGREDVPANHTLV